MHRHRPILSQEKRRWTSPSSSRRVSLNSGFARGTRIGPAVRSCAVHAAGRCQSRWFGWKTRPLADLWRMFQATRDRTARFVCEYGTLSRFAIHQAETGLGIPRISRITRDSVGERFISMARVLSHALGTSWTRAGLLLSRGFTRHQPPAHRRQGKEIVAPIAWPRPATELDAPPREFLCFVVVLGFTGAEPAEPRRDCLGVC
jgi:hypothetical protein